MNTRMLLTSLLLFVCVHAKELDYDWHLPDGSVARGQVEEVFSNLAFISGPKGGRMLSVEKLPAEEIGRVADFLVAGGNPRKPWSESTAPIAVELRNRMKRLENGKLVKWTPGGELEPQVYLVYFSADWCVPCHHYTPKLIEKYKELQALLPGFFEVIFISSDSTAAEQRGYVVDMKMPWPVLNFNDCDGGIPELSRWKGDGIPCLVAVTRTGQLLAHSYQNSQYVGPENATNYCDALAALMRKHTAAGTPERHKLDTAVHVRRNAGKSSQVKPYWITFNPKNYQTVDHDVINVTLEISATGTVTNQQVEEKLGAVIENALLREVQDWLFLPAVENGVAVARKIKLPLALGNKRDQVASANPET